MCMIYAAYIWGRHLNSCERWTELMNGSDPSPREPQLLKIKRVKRLAHFPTCSLADADLTAKRETYELANIKSPSALWIRCT